MLFARRLLLRSQAVAAPAAWSPLDLSPILWLDGSDISALYQDSSKTTPVASDGDVVGCWADKSGNGNDVTQATTANKPLYKTNIRNGNSSVFFDGSNDYLRGAFTQLSQPYHYVAVAQLDSAEAADSGYNFLCDDHDGSNRVILMKNNSKKWRFGSGTSSDDGASDASWNIFTALFNGASSSLRVNGASVLSVDAGTNNASGITVGAINTTLGQYVWKDYIAELIIIDPSMSDADRTSLESYLATKWSITLA